MSEQASYPDERDDDIIVTEPFTTTSGDYLSVLLSEWLPRYGWTLLLPILATAGIGCVLHDERWLLVALMLLSIVTPMAMSFLYTYYMLTPEARRTVLCKRVEINRERYIRLHYVAGEKIDMPLPEDETIPWSHILRVRTSSRFIIYTIKGERMQFLLIPVTICFARDTGIL